LGGEVGIAGSALANIFATDAWALVAAVLLDLALGDPVYRLHPVRLVGGTLGAIERGLRQLGFDGRGGGILLFVTLAAAWTTTVAAAVIAAASFSPWAGWAAHVFFLYSFLALGDLLHHVWRVERAASANDLDNARRAIANLVGRDIDRMDVAACRRAAIESLSESLTDGFTSALFWYAIGGLPGLTLFKVVSTMDSMVGYKTPRYLHFGWCGARLDDLMNFIPARLTWLVLAAVAALIPGCSAKKAFRIGLEQHGVLPGPNSGWSEAATAGGIERRLVGPVWRGGVMVTDVWIGDPHDQPAAERYDVTRAMVLCTIAGLAAVLATLTAMFVR
jgi:adenosylcobinamide-phosphate synthase